MAPDEKDPQRPPRTYAETQERQQEFEELVREEGDDWDEAAEDVRRGVKPRGDETSPSGA